MNITKENSLKQNSAMCNPVAQKYDKRITRKEIRAALNRIYTKEAKPVNVRSIKNRTGLAIGLIVFGAMIVAGVLGIEYLGLEQNHMFVGLIILFTTIPIGFLISTKYMRKIYNSMSRFKDLDIPSYRRVAPKGSLHTQSVIYAVLLCMILLGAYSTNIIMVNKNDQTIDEPPIIEETIVFDQNHFSFEEVMIGKAELDGYNNYHRMIVLEINNSQQYYGKDLLIEVQSWFAGNIYDIQNDTFEIKNQDTKWIPINIHEPDDTTIISFLKYKGPDGEVILDDHTERSVADLYITNAKGVITKTSPFTKSMNITISVYNDGQTRGAKSVSIIVWKSTIMDWIRKGYEENEMPINSHDFWEVSIVFEIFDEDSEFNIELNYHENLVDETKVLSE